MSTLVNELKKICQEEQVSFTEFLEKIKMKNPPKRAQQGDLFDESEP